MGEQFYLREALGRIDDITKNTTTITEGPDYKLGEIISIFDNTALNNVIAEYIYVINTGITILAFQPFVLNYTSVVNQEYTLNNPATFPAPGRYVAIPQVTIPIANYGFALIKGDGKVLTIAETYVNGDHMELLNAGTALVVDGSAGSTVLTERSTGIIKATGTAAEVQPVILLGNRVVIAAT